MRLAEVFTARTIQGEGPATGRVCTFVRTSGCNLDCSWCDTPFTWDWTGKNGRVYNRLEESFEMSTDEVVDRVIDLDVELCIVTGGEPLIQHTDLCELATSLSFQGIATHVETNGTRPPGDAEGCVELFVVSPKLANSGVAREKAIRPGVLEAFEATGVAVLKFVLTGERGEVDEVRAISALAPTLPVWVMPEGRTAAGIDAGLRVIAPIALDNGWNLSTRLHVTLWGDERGR